MVRPVAYQETRKLQSILVDMLRSALRWESDYPEEANCPEIEADLDVNTSPVDVHFAPLGNFRSLRLVRGQGGNDDTNDAASR